MVALNPAQPQLVRSGQVGPSASRRTSTIKAMQPSQANVAGVAPATPKWEATLFRVFLLASTLQVDLAFWPAAEFGATAPTFLLLFGTTVDRPPSPAPAAAELIGMGWLYALHARSSIERGRVWQAEFMISGVRDHVLALACLRHGLPASEGRGMDSLPPDVTAVITGALVGSLEIAELRRALRVASEALLAEVGQIDPGVLRRLGGPLAELAEYGLLSTSASAWVR